MGVSLAWTDDVCLFCWTGQVQLYFDPRQYYREDLQNILSPPALPLRSWANIGGGRRRGRPGSGAARQPSGVGPGSAVSARLTCYGADMNEHLPYRAAGA